MPNPALLVLVGVFCVLLAAFVALAVGARAGDGTDPAGAASAAGSSADPGSVTVVTSFGVLEVGAVTWSRAGGGSRGHQHGDPATGPGYGDHAKPAASTVVAHRHQVWDDQVRVDVTVENTSDQAVLFSPGQLRLSLQGSGATVAPVDAGSAPGPVGPGASAHTWVSFRAPDRSDDLLLEFSDVTARPPLLLPLGTERGPVPGGHDHE